MTVGELKKELQNFNDDDTVFCLDFDLSLVKNIRYMPKEENWYNNDNACVLEI